LTADVRVRVWRETLPMTADYCIFGSGLGTSASPGWESRKRHNGVVSTQPNSFLTPEEYLEIERRAGYKSEYLNGEMFAKSGANQAHNLVVINLVAALHRQFRSRPCQVYLVDMRVHVLATGACIYPDVIAVCDESRFLDDEQDTLLNPGLIVEVLPPSTEAYDRGRKFDQYKSSESLREYLLVASDRVHADLYTRQADGRWLLTSADRLEDSLTLESVGAQLTLADLYEKVEWAAQAAEIRPLKS
jgi:Uma2 family endonuclease